MQEQTWCSYFFVTVMSPPSRILPQRAWAAAVPTLLSHEMLTKLLTASTLPGTQFLPASPLERFFACIHLRRHMQRVIQSEQSVSVSCTLVIPLHCVCMFLSSAKFLHIIYYNFIFFPWGHKLILSWENTSELWGLRLSFYHTVLFCAAVFRH